MTPTETPQGNTLPVPIQAALAAAERATDTPAAEVRLIAYEPVNWPDAALGVREPGRLYAQVITPGYRVRLAIGREEIVYHTDRDERVVRSPTTD